MQGFFDFVKSLGAARLTAMAAVTLSLIGFFSFLIVRMTTPQMVPLFTDMTLDDSASIAKDLDRQAVTYEIKGNGTTILVPKDKVARLRMKLAESGLPKGGGVGYEIFDKSDALGATSFVQNINHLRAMEGELARTCWASSVPRTLSTIEAEGSTLSRANSGRSGSTRWTRAACTRSMLRMVRASSPSSARSLLMFWMKLVEPSASDLSKIS